MPCSKGHPPLSLLLPLLEVVIILQGALTNAHYSSNAMAPMTSGCVVNLVHTQIAIYYYSGHCYPKWPLSASPKVISLTLETSQPRDKKVYVILYVGKNTRLNSNSNGMHARLFYETSRLNMTLTFLWFSLDFKVMQKNGNLELKFEIGMLSLRHNKRKGFFNMVRSWQQES